MPGNASAVATFGRMSHLRTVLFDPAVFRAGGRSLAESAEDASNIVAGARVVVEHGRMVWRPKPKIAALGFVETDLGAEDNWRTLMRDQELYRAAAESRKRAAA